MADNNQNGQQTQNPNPNGNPLQQMKGGTYSLEQSLSIIAHAFESHPDALKDGFNFNITRESQSTVSDKSKWKFERNTRDSSGRSRATGNLLTDFENGIKDQLLSSIAGSNFKQGIQGALDTFAKEFGVQFKDLPNEFGRHLTKKAVDKLKDVKIGDKALGDVVKDKAGSAINALLDTVAKKGGENGGAARDALLKVGQSFLQNNGGNGALSDALSGILSKAGSSAATSAASSAASGVASGVVAEGAGATVAGGVVGGGTAAAGAGVAAGAGGTAAMSGLMTAATSLGPYGLLIAGIIFTLVKVFGPALKGLAEVIKSVGKSFTRDEELRKKRAENAQKRLEADMEWVAKRPFEILQEATEKWEETWDSSLRKIGQTQGYDKEAVYSLYESYAERLRSENLDAVINATDIVDKLTSVLDSGLSGKAAEEFAYAATKLNAAIPTQDFFGYVDTYASVAANALARGKSQSEALAEANAQLESFASNLLYSSRELAGGFSTGLKNGSELFKDAVQIAQTAKKYNAAADISGTLTSVSAIIGSVAPDLASSLVNNVVQAAIGGNNNSQLVALRSLAGINAGNTDFLRQMAEDPQKVFSNLFNTLADLQNMSPDNYMEVAEGLADVFGIDKAAFARVDFNYLAKAIDNMNTNNQSLEENLALLQSGQTTTSAEQLKAQEINRVILDEGLAYVIDSEAGRMVQEHMWDEQRANAMMNNTYAVDLQGSSLKLLEGIRQTITTLLNFLNPAGFIAKGVANMVQTISESVGNQQDLEEMLKLTAVGSNKTSFKNLTTRGKDLELVDSYIEMLGGSKGVWFMNALTKVSQFGANIGLSSSRFNEYNDTASGGLGGTLGAYTRTWFTSGLFDSMYDYAGKVVNSTIDTIKDTVNSALGKDPSASKYTWGVVGKSFAKAVQTSSWGLGGIGDILGTSVATPVQNALVDTNAKTQEFLDSAEEALANNAKLTFSEWLGTASNYGISNIEDALFDFGTTMDDVKNYFESHEARQGAIIEESRKQDEIDFRQETRDFWDYTSGTSGVFQTAMWMPFFGNGQKYDTRMTAVDTALSNVQAKLGSHENHTVIGGLEEISRKLGEDTNYTVISVLTAIESDISNTFVSSSSAFQKCMSDWISYIASKTEYNESISKSTAWSDLKAAEADRQNETNLALANALKVFSAEELQKLDPQLQTNALLGEIVVILEAIMQQNNNVAGGLSLIDTISALGLGMTTK